MGKIKQTLAFFILIGILFSSFTIQTAFGGGEVTVKPPETREERIRNIIKEQERDRFYVTVDGKQYAIVTLRNYIDPFNLMVSTSPTTVKVYVDMEGNPVSDKEIARKIGLIDIAREQFIELKKRLEELKGLEKNIKNIEKHEKTIDYLFEMLKGLIEARKIAETNDIIVKITEELKVQLIEIFEIDEMLSIETTEISIIREGISKFKLVIIDLKELAKFAGPKLVAYLLRKLIWDPISNAKDDLNYFLNCAINYYEEAKKIIEEHENNIVEYNVAKRFLENYHYGQSYDESARFLLGKIFRNTNFILRELKKITTDILSLGLIEIVRPVWEASKCLEWSIDINYNFILKQEISDCDLKYKLSESAIYSLYLSGSFTKTEELDYKNRLRDCYNMAYEKAAECIPKVVDFLGRFGSIAEHLLDKLDRYAVIEKIEVILSKVFSPVELRVFDSQNRVTGLINGQVKEEIPNSIYDDKGKIVIILNSTDAYSFKVVGKDVGVYGLTITSLRNEGCLNFSGTDIPILPNATHEYRVNWINRSITADNPYSAKFKLLYSLRVMSMYGNVSGEGWYVVNTTAYFTITPTVFDYGNGTRHVFVGWKGDVTTDASSASIIMDSPKTVIASWKAQYYIQIESEYGNPVGEGWYDKDAIATISVEPSVPAKDFFGLLGGKYIFVGWSGDITATSPLKEIIVDSPKKIKANWAYDYTMPFVIIVTLAILINTLLLYFVIRRRKSIRY